ncbi:MAG: LamG domain-containing protein [Euryarchaeota archaeon]|nr:LamG domain-containing protein [Euryarchaeota archaeon]
MITQLSPLLKGLVLHVDLDQESYNPATKRFTDKSAYGNHGTSNNAASFVADRMGQANRVMSFDGSSDYVNCGNGESLDITDEITIAAWIKPCRMSGDSDWQNIISKDVNTGSRCYDVFQHLDEVQFFISGASFMETTGANLQAGIWCHVIIVYDENIVSIYINNVTKLNQLESAGIVSNNADLWLGNLGWSGSFDFKGSIDDVRIYNRVLTDTERTLLYESYRPRLII